jgi:hypothetical protein
MQPPSPGKPPRRRSGKTFNTVPERIECEFVTVIAPVAIERAPHHLTELVDSQLHRILSDLYREIGQ